MKSQLHQTIMYVIEWTQVSVWQCESLSGVMCDRAILLVATLAKSKFPGIPGISFAESKKDFQTSFSLIARLRCSWRHVGALFSTKAVHTYKKKDPYHKIDFPLSCVFSMPLSNATKPNLLPGSMSKVELKSMEGITPKPHRRTHFNWRLIPTTIQHSTPIRLSSLMFIKTFAQLST